MPRTHPRIPPGMAKAILGYDAEAAKILQDFINTVEAEKPPPLLYHYTNDAGLAGIIEGGRLWFSHIFALNDPSELRHGLGIAIDSATSPRSIDWHNSRPMRAPSSTRDPGSKTASTTSDSREPPVTSTLPVRS